MTRQLPTVIRGPTRGDGRFYDHTSYLDQQRPTHAPDTVSEAAPIVVTQALYAQEGQHESTSGTDRAMGLLLRLLPLTLISLTLAVGLAVGLATVSEIGKASAFVVGLLVFASIAYIGFHRLNLMDYEYSRSGLERHRIDTAAELKLQEMDNNFRLRRMLLKHQLKLLELQDDEQD